MIGHGAGAQLELASDAQRRTSPRRAPAPCAQITLTLACFNQALLFTPSSTLDSPLQNVWLQEFSWAEADMPADKKRRSAHLRQISMHASAGALERLAAGAVDALGRAEPTLRRASRVCRRGVEVHLPSQLLIEPRCAD